MSWASGESGNILTGKRVVSFKRRIQMESTHSELRMIAVLCADCTGILARTLDCGLQRYGNAHSISYMIQKPDSDWCLVAQLTKKTKVRLVFRFGWIQGLRCCHQDSFSLFLFSHPFLPVDFILKQAVSHMAKWTPAVLVLILVAQPPQWEKSFSLPVVSASIPGLALVNLHGSRDYRPTVALPIALALGRWSAPYPWECRSMATREKIKLLVSGKGEE